MATKTVKAIVRLIVPAAKAAPSPAIGQALGALGVNMMEFCKAFNKRTETLKDGISIPVILTAYSDRSFEFVTKLPPTSFFLRQAAGIETGSGKTGKEIVGEVSVQQIYELAKLKKSESHLSLIPLESLAKSISGTARSLGLRIKPVFNTPLKEVVSHFESMARGEVPLNEVDFDVVAAAPPPAPAGAGEEKKSDTADKGGKPKGKK
eukprot:TRINITY_DN311_c0_g1_i1.p1 TRINITY_DN311_c0_g1~~TRINITY_DN311_c0_g1_i1.p1  ORF type:complete len:229 (-),score=69.76 TRINITY_DN311_c0_g1_i1:260-880(-)